MAAAPGSGWVAREGRIGGFETLSTATAPAPQVFQTVNDLVWRRIGGFDSKASASPDSASLTFGEIGRVGMCYLVKTGHTMSRPKRFIRSDDPAVIQVILQLDGKSTIEQDGHICTIGPREWALCDTARSYAITNDKPIEQILLLLPRDEAALRGTYYNHLCAERLIGTRDAGRLFFDFVLGVYEERDTVESQSDLLADIIVKLFDGALRTRLGTDSELILRQALSERIKAYIVEHLRNPDLDIAEIAGALHCSKSYLHKAFADEPETISNFIWHLRLKRVRDALAKPENLHRPITDLALSWGFNNMAHFSRLFRQHYAVSPSGFRMATGYRDQSASTKS